MKERQRYSLPIVRVAPGDRFICTVHERDKTHQFVEKIGRSQRIDTVVTFDVTEPVLGLVSGIGAIFGESAHETA